MAAGIENGQRAGHVGPHVVERPFDGGHDVADPSQVKHVVGAAKKLVQAWRVRHVEPLDVDPVVLCVMLEVLESSGREVVDDRDLVISVHEEIDEMASDEAGAAGHDCAFHVAIVADRNRTAPPLATPGRLQRWSVAANWAPHVGKRVLVTGGAGYVGCALVPRLLEAGYEVVVYDLLIYGDRGLPRAPGLTIVAGDIRDTERLADALDGVWAVVHLACISNDPSFDLDPALSRSVNYECFEPMVLAAKRRGVRRFVYASTSSVYGLSSASEVTEDHPLVPITDYNRYKGMCEPILLRHADADFSTVAIRPATVCGYSPRMRLDLAVNILTNLAVNRGVITVFGGTQHRASIHIDDLAELYVKLLELPADSIAGQTFNVSHANSTIAELAETVKRVVVREFPGRPEIRVERTESNDPRSYRISSRRIAERLGYVASRSVELAATDVCKAFRAGLLPDSLTNSRYFNVMRMKELGLR